MGITHMGDEVGADVFEAFRLKTMPKRKITNTLTEQFETPQIRPEPQKVETRDFNFEGVNIEVEAVLMLNVEALARKIEAEYIEHLIEPPPGIYLRGRIKPVMVPTGHYYVKSKTPTGIHRIPVTLAMIGHFLDDVYEVGKETPVITKYHLTNRRHFLSTAPQSAYRGFKIAKVLIEEQLDNAVRYKAPKTSLAQRLYPHLRAPYVGVDHAIDWLREHSGMYDYRNALARYQITLDECVEYVRDDFYKSLLRLYAPIDREVAHFIGTNTMNMYFTRWINDRIEVLKCMDWRAFMYEKMQLGSESE